MTVQQNIPVSEPTSTEATPDFSKQLQEVCRINRWSPKTTVDEILDPNTGCVSTSLTAALQLGFIELAEKIIEMKNVDNLEDFHFTDLAERLIESEPINWNIVRSVLDFIKAKCKGRLFDFKCVFQKENVLLIEWWKENFPNFPGSWFKDCSLDYIKQVVHHIKLNECQVMEFLRLDLPPTVLVFVTNTFFNNMTDILDEVVYDRDVLQLNWKHFMPSSFERAVRQGIPDYVKWCVLRFGSANVKREITLANCVNSFTSCSMLTLLTDLLNLTEQDFVENDSAFLTAIVRSNYHRWQWVLENFDLSKVEFTFTPQDEREEWFVKLAKVKSTTVRKYCNVEFGVDFLAKACLTAVREGMMEAVEWIFDNLPDSCFSTSFLREIQIPALEIGNVKLLDLFYNMDTKLDAAAFNYRLFRYIHKPEVLDWIHAKMGISEKHLEGEDVKDLHPNTLLWFLQADVLTRESKVISTFDLTGYIKKHASKHEYAIVRILAFFKADTFSASFISSLIECDFIEDWIVIGLIRDHKLPKNSLWFIKAAECNRPTLHYFLLSHYKGQFKAWETFTPKPLDFKIRNNQQHWCEGIFDFEKTIGSSWDCSKPEVSMELAIAHLDAGHKDQHPVNEIYKDMIRWNALYYGLKKEDPIWQAMLGKCRTSDSKSFIEHDILGMEKKPLTLKELGEGLASGKITLKPNTELSLMLKLCQQVAELSTGAENAEREAALMKEFQEHILQ